MSRLRWAASIGILLFCALASQAFGQAVSFLDENGAAASAYVEGTRAVVRVEDPAANVSPEPDTVQVRLTSTRGGDDETLSLTETGPDTGVFRGEIPLAPAGSSAQPGVLETAVDFNPPFERDTIRAEYGPASATATMVGSRLQFLDAFGRPTVWAVAGQPVRIRLIAPMNNNPQYQDSWFVTVSASSGDQEGLPLQETGFDTGVFEGELPSAVSPAQPSNGVLEAASAGEEISVESPDSDVPTVATASAALAGEGVELVDAKGRPAGFYLESTRVYVEVRTSSPGSSTPGTLQVRVQAELSGDVEAVTLRETGGGTGIFQGSLPMRRGPALRSNGSLETTESGPPYRFDTVQASFGASGAADAVVTMGSLVSFLDDYGNEVTSYAAGAPVHVRVEDHNFNDPGTIDSVQATVRSLSTGDTESLTLYEVARDSGVFETTLPTAVDTPSPADGRLQVSAGGTIQALHVDAFQPLTSAALARIDSLSIAFLDESGRPTSELLDTGLVRVRVVSPEANQDPAQTETLQAVLQTRFSADRETVQLAETGPDTGVFEGAVPAAFGPGAPDNGTLEEANGGAPAYAPEEVTATLPPATVMAHTVGGRIAFVDEFGRETTSVPLGGPVRLRAVFPAANNPQYQDGLFIELQVAGDDEGVVLQETGFDTGIFEGAIDSVNAAPVINDARLEGSVGQTITALLPVFNTTLYIQKQAVLTGGQVSFVDGAGQLATVYLEGTKAHVRVIDHGADVHPSQADTVTAALTTEISGDAESLTLTETGAQTGIFEGAIDVRHGPTLPNSGSIEPGEETGPPHQFDTIHASYTASSSGGVSTATAGTLNSRVWFLDAYGQVTDHYAERTRVYVRVEDHRFDDPGSVDRANVIVRSLSGDQEPLELVETGRSTGIFEGSLALDSAGTPAPDGILQAGPGYDITAQRDTGFTAEPARARIDSLSIAFLDESGRPTSELLDTGLVRVRVVSPEANQDPAQTETLQAVLQTRFSADRETVQLAETGPDTGVFEGAVPAAFGPGAPDNGTLEESNGGAPAYAPEEVTATLPPATVMAHTVGGRIAFVDEFGRETTSVPLGGPVRLRAVFPAANNPQYQDGLFIELQGAGDDEGVVLQETGFDTGIFEGAIDSVNAAPVINNARLEGSVGQTITALLPVFNTTLYIQKQAVLTGGQVSFVDGAGQLATVYLEGTKAHVRVIDYGADVHPSQADTVTAALTTEISGDAESLTLTETGAQTGIFEGAINVRHGPALPNSGSIEPGEETGPPHQFDTIHASYTASSSGGVSTAAAGTLNSRIWFLDAYGQVTDHYAERTRVYVRVEDHRFDDPGSVDRANVIVRSLSGDQEPLELVETGRSTGIFEGSLALDSAGTPAPDGILQAGPGYDITAQRDTGFTAEPARAWIDSLSIAFLDESGRPTSELLDTGLVRVRVVSPAANQDPAQAETLQAVLQTRFSADRETVQLAETGPDTGVFEGAVPAAFGPGAPDNGTLEESNGGAPAFAPEEVTATLPPATVVAHTVGGRIAFVDEFGRETPSVPLGGPVRLRAVFPAANNPQYQDSLFIELQVAGDDDGVVLQETGFDTGIFEGAIDSVNAAPVINNARLEGSVGQTITALLPVFNTTLFIRKQAVFTDGPITGYRVSFLDAAGTAVQSYEERSRVYVRLEDHGANDPGAIDRLYVQLTSSSGDQELLAVDETGVATGIYEGSILLDGSGAAPDDGRLQARLGEEITADLQGTQFPAPVHALIVAVAAPSPTLDFLNLRGQFVASYSLRATVRVRIEDPSRAGTGPLTVDLRSLATGDMETVAAVETAPGVFVGSLPSVETAGAPGDGAITAGAGQVVEMRYGTAIARVTFSSNQPPVAGADTGEALKNRSLVIDVLSNDGDPEGSPVSMGGVTQGAHGSAAVNPDGTVTYTPVQDYYGNDTFTYLAVDDQGGEAVGTVTVTLENGENLSPVAVDDQPPGVLQGSSAVVAVLANDFDRNGDPLTVTAVTQGAHGSVAINPDRQAVTYTAAPGFTGTDTFTYTISDGYGGTATATVAMPVGSINHRPVANDDSGDMNRGGFLTLNVLANDTDPDGDPLTVTRVFGPVVINPDQTVTYTPRPTFSGSDSFTYEISDGRGGTATATVQVFINIPPTANADAATVGEDGTVQVNVVANDIDDQGLGFLRVTSVTQGAHGTVAINPDKTVSYTPVPNYNGMDSFTYTITDAYNLTSTGTVTVTITPVNDPPVAVADAATVGEDGSVDVTVLANDTDVDNDTLSVASVTQGTHGTVSINANGTVAYAPQSNYNGSDSFTYSISDGQGGTATGTVTVAVTSANDAPAAATDTATVAEDGSVSIAVLANDTDADGDTLSVASVTQGTNGTAVINPDKTVKYTPAANFHGTDAFTYTVADGNGGTATATVTVTITSVNDPPVAVADAATVGEDGSVNVTVLANDTDVDGDTLSVASITQGAHGAVAINPDKTVRYTPAANYNGADSFTYTLADGNGGTATGTVAINVSAMNDGPIANPDAASLAEDGLVSIAVLANDTDPEGDTLSVTAVTQGAHGAVVINPDKTVKYTPAANYNGADSFTYAIADGNGGTATAAVTVTVAPVDDAPVAVNDSAAAVAGSPVTVSVLANDSDVDGPALSVTGVTQGLHGAVAINGGQTVTYTAGLYVGPDSFTYTVSDGAGGTATATVTVNVTAPQRVAAGLQARYDFNEGSGDTIQDTSGVGTPLNLTIKKTSEVSWLSGGLAANSKAKIASDGPATKINDAARSSNSITVEAWLLPSSLTLNGPAGILRLAKNPAQRNLVFGQSGGQYETELKTSTGRPSLQSPSGSLRLELTHVVYTRSGSGAAVYYVNGIQVASQTTSGSLSAWDSDQKLTLADDWQGDYFLMAVYGRALTGAEVQQNYLAGVNAN